MKNKILIGLSIVFSLLFFSCQKTDDLTNIRDSFTLKRNGAEMPVYTYGNVQSKIFVLTLHGGPGADGLSFRNTGWNVTLEEKYAMVYYDQRGSGMSQGNLSTENLNLEEMKKDVLALVALLKHKYGDDITLFLLGHSWGTMLGGHVLVDGNNQDLFNGYISAASIHDWCLLGKDLVPAYTQVADEQIAANNDIEYWNEMLDLAADIDTTDCTDSRLNLKGSKSNEVLEKRGIVNAAIGSIENVIINNSLTLTVSGVATNSILFDEDNLAIYDLTTKLYNITIPSIVLHGKYDLQVALKTGEAYFDLLGSSDKTFHQFDKSAHSMFATESEEFGNIVLDFIEAHK